jgi:hypothetical protein
VGIKNPRTLVVDASIAQASGTAKAIHPIPVRCRDFLREIYHLGHKVIFTDEILTEWKNHQEEFAKEWYAEMTAKGKIVRVVGNSQDSDLREAILDAIQENARHIVEKDLHLVEAAKITDEIIASWDNTTQKHLKNAAIKVEAIKTIIWINPTIEDENCIIWLREGALYEVERCLAYVKPQN